MSQLNGTHDPALKSWVKSANEAGADFPIQNLPFGVFRANGPEEYMRGGVAIGDQILDIDACLDKDLFEGAAKEAAQACTGLYLNPLMALGGRYWSALRARLSELLREGGAEADLRDTLRESLVPMVDAEMAVPAQIGDFTDFFSSVNHATHMGMINRPDNPNPLMPNFKHVPIAYHGRSSSIRVSGEPTIRPMGQSKAPDADSPSFGPSKRLDYETELGIFVGPGNNLGAPFAIDEAEDHIFGINILNDWSARDIQGWEYQPLGPFLAKNFATHISPWIVTLEAMAPFRTHAYNRPDGDPAPLPYLSSPAVEEAGGLDIRFETSIQTARMRTEGVTPQVIGATNFKDTYWTIFQMVTHHASNGCDLHPGDYLGSGTISGQEPGQFGSIMEASWAGQRPIELPTGETRTFLEDGDEVIMRAWCEKEGAVRIGLGECRSKVKPPGPI
ncbi:MAG: fumarylacetoacetase [Rhodospirillales bacterium]|nr:fumarylacetoacetase [Rhodospirillales bacterium]